MRLLYWYTRFLNSEGSEREYRGLTHFEINLSTTERFHFDPEVSLFTSASLEPPLPSGFWGGNINNLHVLTGNNGAGKSTIMNYIMDTLHELYRRELKRLDETVFALEIEGKSFLVYLPGCSKSREKLFAPMEQYYFMPGELPAHHRILDAIDRTKLIYLTNTLSEADDQRVREYDFHDHIRYHFIYDCSTSGLIRYDEIDDCYSKDRKNVLLTYFTYEFYKQVRFVCDKEQYNHLLDLEKKNKPVPVPKELFANIRLPKELSYFKIYDSLMVFIQHTDILQEMKEPDKQPYYLELLTFLLCASCVIACKKSIEDTIGSCKSFEKVYSIECVEYTRFESVIKETIDEIKATSRLLDTNNAMSVFLIPIDRYSEQMSAISLCEYSLSFVRFIFDEGNGLLDRFTIANNPDSFFAGGSFPIKLNFNEENAIWFTKFMRRYRLACSPYYFIDFSWGLSSGENNLLRLFSSLYYLLDSNRQVKNKHADGEVNDCNTIILVIDEADLTYHPEWQRQFVSVLTAFLPKVYGNCGVKDIQVLLSTHSPLLLGDIPKNNVSYLTSGMENANAEEIETFGQNIHQILKNSFFLSNGTVGAFAEEKINNTAARLCRIAKLLKEEEEPKNFEGIEDFSVLRRELERCRQVIDLVAPGILKSKLMELYREAESSLYAASGEEDEIPIYKQAQQMSREQLEVLIRICQSELERREWDD